MEKTRGGQHFSFFKKKIKAHRDDWGAHNLTAIGGISHRGGYHRPMGQDAYV